MLSHIVAVSENNIIGSDNSLPWKLSSDFKYFKNKTWGMPVIMGRKTFESMQKDLPGRMNIVVTSRADYNSENAFVVHSIEEALAKAKESEAKEIFVIGGGKIFMETLGMVDRIYLTRVHATVNGDTYYPELPKSDWKQISTDPHPADEKNNYPYTFEVWERK
ncbi:MAG: dihydrofolate reductase [Ginsengibacter sp.]